MAKRIERGVSLFNLTVVESKYKNKAVTPNKPKATTIKTSSRLLKYVLTTIPRTRTSKYIIIQLGIRLPSGTLPIIIIIPANKSSVASKFLALNARYDADAT